MDDELLIEAFIRHEVKCAVGRGYDRTSTYSERQAGQKVSLPFINNMWFEVYCMFLGYDPELVRRRVREEAVQKLGKKKRYLAYQRELV